jgi:hypothetical protein
LFVCSFAVYNANFQRIASGDTVAASLLPFSLLLDGSVAADRFYPYVAEHLPQHTRGFHLENGHAGAGGPEPCPGGAEHRRRGLGDPQLHRSDARATGGNQERPVR